MNKSEQINELATALASFQSEVNAIQKDRTAKVKMKNGGEYTYAYADLATVIETCKPHLAKHGLSVTQMTEASEKGFFLVTIVMHKSGQWISGLYPLPREGDPQEIGSEITYARRYSLCAALGVAAEEDDDTNRKVSAPDVKWVTNHAPTTAAAAAPAASQATTQGPAAAQSPDVCEKCGKKSMISKMNNAQFYCVTCKTTRPRSG